MAFAKGNESKETVVKRYIGVAPVNILAVNPTKEELSKIYNTDIEKAPEYVGKTTINEKEYDQVRIDFIVRNVVSNENDPAIISKLTFFITNIPEYNRTGEKARVINKYGEDAWLPIDNIKAGTVPDNMAWYCNDSARPAFRGEKDLTDFLKNFLVIPNRTYTDRNTGERKTIEDLSLAEAQLGKVKDYFSGNISEIKEIIASQPNNKVKVCFGVKTADDGKMYQDIYTRKVLRLRVSDYSNLDKDIADAKANGAYSHTEFSVEPLHEYVVSATTFTAPANDTAIPAPADWFTTKN